MNILVINGSPKGAYSITLQSILYLSKKYPAHHFEILHAGQTIGAMEKDFSKAAAAISDCDLSLFSYPVYTFIAPSQLHRFIELLKASGLELSGKIASQITTSKHFYDVTAHRYIQDNMADLGIPYIRGLSADMEDLTKKTGQKQLCDYFEHLLFAAEHKIFEPVSKTPDFTPVPCTVGESVPKTAGDIVIVTDLSDRDVQLGQMIDRFVSRCPRPCRVINLRKCRIDGGCLGCFRCAVSGKCVYKDKFDSYLRETIQTGEAIVYAFTVRDHSMGALFKKYDDRQFCNGHRTVTMGMPMGYLISGPYQSEYNLQMIIEGRSQVGSNPLCGVATDEVDPDGAIDRLIDNLNYALDTKLSVPQNFLGVGGMKIFRDLIWGMQGMMRADHKFYKSHGQYDFPQKHRGRMIAMYAVGALLSNPKILARMGNKMSEGMLMPYKKVLDKVSSEE